MRFHSIALLTGATAVAAGNTATLLLPGFQGRDLQAGILNSNGETTTYLITCPTTVAASACGILGNGMTAMAAPTTMSLVNADSKGGIASIGCNLSSTTYASCLAQDGTVTVSHTLNSKNLNFMPVTVTGPCSTSTPTPTSTPTSTSTSTSTITPTSTVTPTSTLTPISSPKKSTSKPASSTRMVTSSAALPSSTETVITGTPLPAASTGPASATPSAAGAVALSGNGWALGGVLMAMFYALA